MAVKVEKGKKKYPEIADDLNVSWTVMWGLGSKLSLKDLNLCLCNLDLGWGLFWDGFHILSRENLPQVLVSLSQRTWIMENLSELCGSSSLLLSCDAENEPFPLGPAARSGFGVTVFCTYVNRYKGLFVSTTEYLKWDQSCRSKGRIWPWVWISLKDTILSSLLVNELQSL